MVFMIIIPMKNGYFIGNIPHIFRQTHIGFMVGGFILDYILVLDDINHTIGGAGLYMELLFGWWFGTCFSFHFIYGIILPIDFHIFQNG